MSRLPNDADFKAEEGGVMLSLNDNGAEAEYSAVELVAMILSSAQVCNMTMNERTDNGDLGSNLAYRMA